MRINESAGDEVYLTYRNAGPTVALIVPAILLNIFTISGVCLNSIVVIVTVCTKSLHGTAHLLMAMICVFEVLHQIGHLLFLVIVASGINFIAVLDSLHILALTVFGLNASIFGMTCAAFDRLFAVVAQHKHLNLNKPIYLSIHALLCVCYGIYSYLLIQNIILANPGAPTTGSVTEIFDGEAGRVFFMQTIILCAISASFYVAVGLVIRFKNGVTRETNARLLKSLIVILAITIGGYFFNLCIFQILYVIRNVNPVLIWHVGFVSAILLNLGAACNGPILYLNSSEYRKAFKRNLHKLMGKSSGDESRMAHLRTTQVNPTPSLASHNAGNRLSWNANTKVEMLPRNSIPMANK